MLSFDRLNIVGETIIDIYDGLQQADIKRIAKHLLSLSFETAKYEFMCLQAAVVLYEEILDEIAKATKNTKTELRKVFTSVVRESPDNIRNPQTGTETLSRIDNLNACQNVIFLTI